MPGLSFNSITRGNRYEGTLSSKRLLSNRLQANFQLSGKLAEQNTHSRGPESVQLSPLFHEPVPPILHFFRGLKPWPGSAWMPGARSNSPGKLNSLYSLGLELKFLSKQRPNTGGFNTGIWKVNWKWGPWGSGWEGGMSHHLLF